MLTHVRLFSVIDFSRLYFCYHAAEIAWNQKRKEWVGDQSKKAQKPSKVSTIWYMHIYDFHPYIHIEN